MNTLSPAPVDAETWVAVLIVVARQLMDGGYEAPALRIYEAPALRIYEAIAQFEGQQ